MAMRVGASLACLASSFVSPHTRSDSIHGNAIDTPKPRSIVRRESWQCILFISSSALQFMLKGVDRQSILIFGQASADVPELLAGDDRLHRHTEPEITGFQAVLHFLKQ